MNKPIAAFCLTVALSIVSAATQAATNASAEPLDMDPAVLSKLALERAKMRNQARKNDFNNAASNGLDGSGPTDCGAVNIGNVVSGGRPGFQPRDVTVVITGDVINANNKCK